MGMPTYFLLFVLAFQGTAISFIPEYVYIQSNATSAFYALFGLTFFAWILELVAMKMVLPNLLSVCAFSHSAVGSWWLVNFCIVAFAGWSYVPIRVMFLLLLSVLIPAVIWHITGDILREYKQKLLDEIARRAQGLAAQDQILEEQGIRGAAKV